MNLTFDTQKNFLAVDMRATILENREHDLVNWWSRVRFRSKKIKAEQKTAEGLAGWYISLSQTFSSFCYLIGLFGREIQNTTKVGQEKFKLQEKN